MNTSGYKVVLVVPDLFAKSHVEAMIHILLHEFHFQAIAIIQESLASCYGAGMGTSACVINVGAKETKVACVNEGTVLENSIVKLSYGGDDITRLFVKLLKMNDFPFHEWDISKMSGWRMAEKLKKECVTFQDESVTVQLFKI